MPQRKRAVVGFGSEIVEEVVVPGDARSVGQK